MPVYLHIQDDKNFLTKAKRENQVIDFQHIKILLTGSAAVGKTSFCRLLFSSKFSNNYESTEILESKQAISIMSFSMMKQKSRENSKEVMWLKLDPKNQRAHFKSLLKWRKFYKNELETKEETQTVDRITSTCHNTNEKITSMNTIDSSVNLNECTNDMSKNTDVNTNDIIENVDIINIDTSEKMDTDITYINETINSKDDASMDGFIKDTSTNAVVKTKHELQTDIENRILSNDPLDENYRINKNEAVKLITVIDTGGQPEYIHMLPTINNCPTVNFVVHNMTKNLDDPVIVQYKSKHNENFTDYPLHYTNLDMIGLLMSLTTDSLEQPTKEVPTNARISVPNQTYMGFIGTHKDKLEGNLVQRVSAINKKLTSLIDERHCRFAVMTAKDGILFPVDNTTAGAGDKEDPVVKELRQKIASFMNELTASKVSNNCLPITWMILELELQELHEDLGTKYITCEEYTTIATEKASIVPEEVEESLQYFDFLGVFLHFKKVPGLCDYVVIDHQWLFDNLAKIMHLSPDDINFQDYYLKKQFEERRLLAKSKLCIIHWNDKLPPQHFFDLLIFLKVIATVMLDKVEYYYMPCILSSINQYHDKNRFLYSEPLLIQFSSGFLPRGFFCSLVVHLLQDLPTGWDHQLHNTEHFSNVITFRLPDKSFLRLHDKTSYLEIHIRHYIRNLDIFYHSKVFPVLSEYFRAICSKLKFNREKLQYGFLCHDGKSNDDHIAVIKPFKFPLPSELECCRKCQNLTKLKEFHKIWFEEVSSIATYAVMNLHRP